ncbi:MAG TPA: ABC transporter permease [Bacillota bacterium]|jgi:peptide/nickel transport system permease protein|nr:ABC transporter permease [Fastidiosipila sp.]HPX93334.1 ABC transporter permease [Bacillota bacterium]HQB80529.1 ABC transporter permease [Bacillota bacterium]
MWKYILKRLGLALLIIVGVSVLIYMLSMLMPLDYIDNQTSAAVQSGAMTLDDVQRLKELYGLADKSLGGIIKGYSKWLQSTLSGDLGFSFLYGKPVTKVLGDYIWISFIVAFLSYILEIIIGIPMGIKAAVNQYSTYDYTVSVFAMMGTALPSFFLSALLMNVFAIKLKLFPLQGLVTATKVFAADAHLAILADKAWHLVLPITVLTMLGVGGVMKFTRTNMLEVLNSDYIRTARAKGLSEHTVTYKHAFRNTMIPLVTSLSGMLPGLFGGAMITETVFAIPGIGYMALRATQQGDIPFIMGYNMFLAILTVTGMLISDLMYMVVDPRVKLS